MTSILASTTEVDTGNVLFSTDVISSSIVLASFNSICPMFSGKRVQVFRGNIAPHLVACRLCALLERCIDDDDDEDDDVEEEDEGSSVVTAADGEAEDINDGVVDVPVEDGS